MKRQHVTKRHADGQPCIHRGTAIVAPVRPVSQCGYQDARRSRASSRLSSWSTLAHAFRNENGQASVEYALLAALVPIAAISLMAALGLEVKGLFKAFLDVFP